MTPLRGYQEGFSYCGEGVEVTPAGVRMVWSVYFQDACRVRMDVWGSVLSRGQVQRVETPCFGGSCYG